MIVSSNKLDQQFQQKQVQQQIKYSNDDCIISGMLNIRSINAYGVRKWVPHNVQIIANDNNSYYQLEITLDSKNKNKPSKKKYYSFNHQNTSKVEPYTKHDNAFILHMNCIDKTAPVLYFSTSTKETYDQWLSAISVATNNTITSKTTTSCTQRVGGCGQMVIIERNDSRNMTRSIPSSFHIGTSTASTTATTKKREQSLLVLTPEEQEEIDLALAIEASNNDIAILHSNVNDFLDTLEDD